MKIAVFSDSHKKMSGMERAVFHEKPDIIFHLGDHDTDALALGRIYPHIPLYSVCGNCDLIPASETRLVVSLAGKTVFAAHGHTYSVKFGLKSIINTAMSAGADILLFGHTHVPYYEVTGGLTVINPGAVGQGLTYGILTLDGDKIDYEKKFVYDLPME